MSKLGMGIAFDEKADFSGITAPEPLAIGAVIHKAFLDVNEEGTEAAAATAVIMAPGAAAGGEPEPPVFRADHPFIVLIRDVHTHAVVFLGRIVDPRGAAD